MRNTIREPRVVGRTYLSGYWMRQYTVLALTMDNGWLRSITVRWEDGRIGTHGTHWDARVDRVCSGPIKE